jgi:2-polyprenyl-3-methyl-5-hydroxy-6-metoxy-1,4-benzoquinol methylase
LKIGEHLVPALSLKGQNGNRITLKQDPTNGYESIARDFLAYRSKSTIGAETIRSWARTLGPKAVILDLGCGNGIPITETLVREGHTLYGIDSSPTLISSYREHFPGSTTDEGDNYYYYAKKVKSGPRKDGMFQQ